MRSSAGIIRPVSTDKSTRLSGYGIQLREKQKVRRIYGLLERQFRHNYFQADPEQRHHR